jgi:hypothetical protein
LKSFSLKALQDEHVTVHDAVVGHPGLLDRMKQKPAVPVQKHRPGSLGPVPILGAKEIM